MSLHDDCLQNPGHANSLRIVERESIPYNRAYGERLLKLSDICVQITPPADARGAAVEFPRDSVEEPADCAFTARHMVDQAFAVEILGLKSGERIDLTSRLRDDRKRLWESHAIFTADDSGAVLLAKHAPVAGNYAGVDAMGLFWSLALDPARSGPPTPFTKKDLAPAVINLIVERKHTTAATARIERHFFAPGTRIRDVQEDGLAGRLFIPPGAGKRPTVIVMGGSGGGLDWEKAAVLSSHGYITLALAYFGITPLPKSLQSIPLEYFATAIAWLLRQPDVDGERMAVMGMSKGGELALLLGAHFREVRAVIAAVPSAVVWPGFGKGLYSSWTYNGKQLPFVPTPTRWFRTKSFLQVLANQPIAFRHIYEAALENREAVERAAIPVERIHGPVLLISGSDDQVWPSARMSRMIMERLATHAFPHPREHLCCEGAGHTFRCPHSPATISRSKHPSMPIEVLLGGSPAAHARAQLEAWQRTLQFLKQHL
jgi:dienelactone hydrolase